MNRLTWLGHSTVLIEVDGARLLTDPVLRRRVWQLHRDAAVEPFAQPPDGVLISHLHYDHLDLPSLARLDRGLTLVVPRGAARLVRRRGFARVVEIEEGEEVEIAGVRVHATHAEHDGSRRPFGVRASALGYVVEGTTSVYFAGDTDLFEGMASLGRIDAALLPVAGWGPRLPEGHLNPESAVEALRLIRPALAVPIHWGTLRPLWADAPTDEPAQEFARLARDRVPEVEVRVLRVGAACALGAAGSPGPDDDRDGFP